VCTQTIAQYPDETVEVLMELVEVEVQTEVGFESMIRKSMVEFETRLKKTESEKAELIK
jgi:hypothetical protein